MGQDRQTTEPDQAGHEVCDGIGVLIDGVHSGKGWMGEGFLSCCFKTRLRFLAVQHLGARHAGGLQAVGSSDGED